MGILIENLSISVTPCLGVCVAEAEAGEGRSAQAFIRHGLATFGAFVVAGAVPLGAYLLPLPSEAHFPLTGRSRFDFYPHG